ncbi:MAG: BTAD domain-containing putative transcriptional regulator [Caldilineaceae bacterium]
MVELQITCFGPFKVTLAGTPLTAFQTDKTRALLTYLVINGEVQQRTALVEFLWPGYSKESAQNSFRQTLHQLRQLLGDAEAEPPWLLLTRQTVQINPAASIRVDVLTFQQLLAECKAHVHTELATCASCLERLRQAVDLYQGDFLAELAVVESDAFEEWRRILQEQLHIQMLAALSQLADAAESAGDVEGALQAAQRQLALEPWLEAAHRQIMRILAQRGQRAAALVQYQRCRQVLAEEFGAEPDAETTALYAEIQRGSLAKATPKRTRPQDPSRPESVPIVLAPDAPSTLASIPVHNLPRFPTPLVGRAQVLAELVAQLQRPEVRLLTLVGPGGMGKTRLAVEVGRECAASFGDGVFFVPLAPLSTADALAPAIAQALGLTLQGGDPQRVLLQLISQKRLLLILDNFEHLLAEVAAAKGNPTFHAVDLVMALLNTVPGVQIIVTSRERLKLRGEQTYAVPALAFSTTATLAEAVASAAVRLFVQSIQRMQGDFQLTAANLPAVLRICHAVQGMPLGLELAAANARGAPLTAIADALEQSAEVLSVDWRDLPERQRSMRAVFTWSWQLLNAEEQRILRQCAVFRGGFMYTAVQAVTGATLPLLTRLVDKSLLQWQATVTGEGRYAFHELLRQFADEELETAGERTLVEERHGQHYLAYLAAHGLRLARSEPKEADTEIRTELDNVRQAWRWAATQGRLVELDQALYGWWQFCQFNNLEVEGPQSFAAAVAGVRQQLARAAGEPATVLLGQRLLAKLLAIHAEYLFAQGRDEEMAAQAREAIQLGVASGGVEGETYGVFALGRALNDLAQKREAVECWQQVIQLVHTYQPSHAECQFLDDLHWRALVWLRGGALHFGDYASSRAYMVRSLQLAQTLGSRRYELQSLASLGQTDFFLFDFVRAEPSFKAALDLARPLGYRGVEMDAQDGLGMLAWLRGDYPTAVKCLEQALQIATDFVSPYEESMLLAKLIRLYCQLGDQVAVVKRQEQLTQLLARVKLPPECQLAAYLAAALRAYYTGDAQLALRYAEQANQLTAQGEILFRLVETALSLGHTRAAVGQWEQAAVAFQQALTAFEQFEKWALAAEPRAGLAQIALAEGDLANAQAHVEAILPVLAEMPRAGYNNAFFIYLVCYRVLATTGDSRAPLLLQKGYDLLQQDAATLDEVSRQRFLSAVPPHRELVAAYDKLQTHPDNVTPNTGRTGQADKGSESPAHLGTVGPRLASPSHLVALPPLLDWAEMPAVDFFVERRAEMAQLMAWLTPGDAGGAPARLISILGMGGMGKTTLAATVTKAVAPSFAVVIWRSLLNAPPLDELLRNWLQILSRQTLTAPPASFDEQLRQLLAYLRQERCLLVLDNVESLFAAEDTQGRAGVIRPGYEGYDQLLQRLASSDHQSCLLLTSREQPYALLRLGRQAQETGGRIRMLPLPGLDRQAGNVLLQSNGLHTSAEAAAQLVDHYSGNPLALQIVAATIADFFGGDVAAFQAEEGSLFDGMRLVLDQQFARLSPLERDILVWLAIEREALTAPTLRSNFVQTVSTRELIEALQALQNRSLLEKRDAGFTLQNVIIEYTTDYLVEQVYQEILDLRLTIYDLRASAPDVDLVNRKSKIVNSFLNRFALLKAQAKEYVRQSQLRLIVQPLAQQLLGQQGQRSLMTHIRELLEQLRAHAPHTPGYAAGNLLNLLLVLGGDLTGYDFSDLCVWQAYLREITLPQLNFTNAELRSAAFTDTFDIVGALAYSPDGRFLAAGTSDGEIRLWRATDGQLLANVKGHGDIVRGLLFPDDGKTLISYSYDLSVAVWQVDPAALAAAVSQNGVAILRLQQRSTGFSNVIAPLAIHPQGELLALGSDTGWLGLWHLGANRLLNELTFGAARIHALRFSTDGKTLAMAASDRRIYLWDVDVGAGRLALRQSLAETPAVALDLSFRAADGALASGHQDGSICLWAMDAAGYCLTGEAVQVLSGHRAAVWRLAFSPDGQLLASGSDDHSVRLWKMGPAPVWGQPLARFDEHRGWVRSLAFSPDSLMLASAGADRTVRVWDLHNAQLLYTFYGYVKAVKSIAFCPNSHLLVSGSDDQRVRLWDVAQGGRCLQTWAGHTSFIWQVAVSPDGRLVASGSEDQQIYVRDASNGQVRKILTGHDRGVTALAFSPDGALLQKRQLLASGGEDCRVILWDVASGAPIRIWEAASQVVWAVAFSPDQAYLAFGGEPNRIRLWHLPSQQFHPALENETGVLQALAFSPDGKQLAAAGHNNRLFVWQLGSAAPPMVLQGHQHWIWSLAFSPDGSRLASASLDQTVRLWDLQRQTEIRTLVGHDTKVCSVAFSSDGALLASASEDETIRLWDGVTGEALHVLPIPGPYAGTNITGVTGISEAQKAALRALGAVEE